MRNMKDSGIEWIGEIPEEWEKVKLKDYYIFEKGKNASLYTKEYLGANVGTFPVYSGQTENEGIMGSINSFDYDVDECLFTTTVGAKVMSPKVISGKFSLSQNCLIMKQIKKCNNKFIYYLLLPLFEYEKSMIPIYMQPSLRISDLNKYMFYIPSLNEQELIANYLDNKVKEIENSISKTKETIEEYKKYKQSVIKEVVTKGLNPNIELKDSGIEWIGEIPKHWNTITLGMIFQFIGGYAFKSDKFSHESNNQVIRLGNIKNDNFILNDKEVFIDDEYAKEARDYLITEDDILFTMTGTKGKRDYFYTLIVKNKHLGYRNLYLNQRVGCFRKKINISMDYYNYALKNSRVLDSIFIYETGSANQGNLGIENIKKTKIHFPPENEQINIANFLDKKCNEIDNLILKKEKLVEELEQYKKSLIYECVTGKKEVSPAYAD